MSLHEVDVAVGPQATLELLEAEASSWGGTWSRNAAGGHLELPVLAGVRRGWVEGPVTVTPSPSGSRLTFRVETSRYRVEPLSVFVLTVAALGALAVLLAPFVPAMLPLMPVGFLLTVAAWLFGVARLRNSGPEEFLEELAAAAAAGNEEPPEVC